jgi:hypothetical protein
MRRPPNHYRAKEEFMTTRRRIVPGCRVGGTLRSVGANAQRRRGRSSAGPPISDGRNGALPAEGPAAR